MQITTHSKRGAEVTLVSRGGQITATAAGIDLGPVTLGENTIRSKFETRVNGKPTNVVVEFDQAQWADVEKIFRHAKDELDQICEENREYDRNYQRVTKAMEE